MPKNYFSWVSIFMLLLSLIAFSDNLFYDIGQESNSDPKFIVHGLFFLAWFVILVVQSNFIRKGDIRAHRKWGMWGMGIALGVILSTFYVFYAVYEGWEAMPGFVKVNRVFTVSFTVLVALAYWKRTYPALHKRFLFVGTFYVLGPVIDRVGGKLLGESLLNIVFVEGIIWNGLFISLFLYDKQTLKRIHPISWIGFIWFYIFWIYSILAE
ncbi:hypothetical protein D0X99_11545 [Algoriphagus lacus]|uniref:Uncharacterized protein n=1 Tax=Algoriphagus lacus TaxID=2056311 RepID=A0A418PR78_9BACT|nr:hypothetical protein [Algoriphagus lacus]RIW15075.1 hypothetical protein D0X99_11545 [Algoriphagus lacus]